MKNRYISLAFFTLLSTFFQISCTHDGLTDADEVERISTIELNEQSICGTNSIHSGDYWLNNNDWGAFNEGFEYQCVWLESINNWGAYATHSGDNASGIKGYPSMVYGTQEGVSTNDVLPLSISDLGDVNTWWSWSASGRSWNAAYDIWFNENDYELMIWMDWLNAYPVGNSLGAVATNVELSGHTWNVYRRDNIISFLLVEKQSWISLHVKPIIDYCVSREWIPSNATMSRIEAGWEIIDGGDFKTRSFGISRVAK